LSCLTARFENLHPVLRFLGIAFLGLALSLLITGPARAQYPGSPVLAPSQLTPAASGYSPTASGYRVAQLPPYVDLDGYAMPSEPYEHGLIEPWTCQLLPDGLVFQPFLAGVKESRMSTQIFSNRQDSTLWDATLGARVGLFRYGTRDPFRPDGWQVDAEGSGQVRLDLPEDVEVRSADFRGGLPISYGLGPHRVQFGYYHLSSHLGDEFLLRHPGFPRLNYSRDALLLGYAYYFTPQLRSYAQTAWAFRSDVAKPWEFEFGMDYAPCGPTGIHGAPFFAIDGHLRQEVNYSGGLSVQAGWAWRGDVSGNMLRTGLHYYNGKSNQFSFFDEHEEQIGFGVWYDF